MIKRKHNADTLTGIFVCLSFAIVALLSCNDDGHGASQDVKDNVDFNRLYEELITTDDFIGASRHLNKAYDEEKIGKGQREFLEAMVVYRSLARFDSVLSICENALTERDVKGDDMLSYCIYSLMTNAAMAAGNNGDMLQYASKTEELAHSLGMKTKEQEMKATVGFGMVLMGHEADGFRMIDNALDLLHKYSTWDSRNSYLIATKLKVVAYDRTGRLAEIPSVCYNALALLDQMEAHPESVKDKPQAWVRDKKLFAQTINLYRTQIATYLTYAFAKTGNMAEAKKWLAEFDKSELSELLDCQRMIVSALGEMRLYDRMVATYALINRADGNDTVNESYCEELDMLAREATNRGDTWSASNYLRRALALKDTLNKRQNMSQMARTISLYKVHDEQMKAKSAEYTAKFVVVIVAVLLAIVAIAIAYIIRLNRQRNLMLQKNKALVNSIDRQIEYKDKYDKLLKKVQDIAQQDDSENGNHLKANDLLTEPQYAAAFLHEKELQSEEDRKLFGLIEKAICDGQLYLNPDFQRQTLVEILHVDRNRIGRAIRECSGFSNLSAYINSFRLDYACRMLRNLDNKQTIDSFSKAAGFTTVRTFQRLFKERYGMTPAEFRESYAVREE